MDSKRVNSIDEYISMFPKDIQEKLKSIRNIVKQEAPQAIEKISYQMPTFYLNGNLIHFAVAKKHIGIYPTPSGVSRFENDLKGYKYSKGAIQFPLDKPLPTELIKAIVKFRVKENIAIQKSNIKKQ